MNPAPVSALPITTIVKVPRHDIVSNASVRDLLTLYGQIIDELRDRRVVRTANSPVGDYAEQLFSKAFQWKLQGNSAAGYDAEFDGVLYQIKARRISRRNPSRQLGAIRRLPEKTFDMLAAVLFDEHFTVVRAALIPHEVVLLHAKRVEHTNSWRFILDDKVWQMSGVKDVAAALKLAQDTF